MSCQNIATEKDEKPLSWYSTVCQLYSSFQQKEAYVVLQYKKKKIVIFQHVIIA